MKEQDNITKGGDMIRVDKGCLRPRVGTYYKIINNDPFIDNGIYEYIIRREAGLSVDSVYEYGLVLRQWYKDNGDIVDIKDSGYIWVSESMLRSAKKLGRI